MEGEDGDGGDGDEYTEEHEGDEPGGSICRFWRGLGDSKGVNEDIREVEEKLHGFFEKAASSNAGMHLFLRYALRMVRLPPWWRETTLIR
jgi:hypothetical protein